MGRRPDPERRAELLERVLDYVLEHGLSDLSLRSVASALGTSARMLVYHFGSKEALVAEVLGAARDRQRAMLNEWAEQLAGTGPTELLRWFWAWSTDEATRPFLRLFFEVYGLALTHPGAFPGFLDDAVDDWLPLIEAQLRRAGLAADDAEPVATLVLASHRGLLLDLLATGDEARIERAHTRIVGELERRLNTTPHEEVTA